jgi:hypothetical protein
MQLPNIDFSKPQDEWELPVVFPLQQGGVVDVKNGPRGEGRIVSHMSEEALRRDRLIVRVHQIPEGLEWIEGDDNFDAVCAVSETGEELIYLRDATDKDKKDERVPRFIQGDEYPLCCGRSMVFVGQIDETHFCKEPPPDAQLWWHDEASFYVYTCCICLECKAIGQQF